jgi:glycosyltransferase involved in cell wall biosynthesis
MEVDDAGGARTAPHYRILYHHRTRAADGQRVHIKEVQHALRLLGHTVIEVAPIPATAPAGGVDASAGWRAVFSAPARLRIPGVQDLLQWLYNGYAAAALLVAVRRHRPAFVYERYALNTLAGGWVARWAGIPLLLEVNSPLAFEQDRLGKVAFPPIARAIERRILRAATRVFAVSTPLRDMIVASAGLDPQRTAVLPNGVDPQRFSGDRVPGQSVRARLGLGPDDIVVGAVAFFLEWHGIDRLVDWLQTRARTGPRVVLLLVGDGPALPGLKAAAAACGMDGAVHCTGAIEHQQVPGLVAAMDIVVMPDAVPYASPLKLFEYMAAGKAIVAPRQPNVCEILTHEVDALLFAPGDIIAMREAVQRLSSSAPLRARLGGAARQTIARRELTWEGNARRIIAEFEQIAR